MRNMKIPVRSCSSLRSLSHSSGFSRLAPASPPSLLPIAPAVCFQRRGFSTTRSANVKILPAQSTQPPSAVDSFKTPSPSVYTLNEPLFPQKHGTSADLLRRRYTASDAFFEALWEAGVQACFVNLGSDHPTMIEAMIKGSRLKSGQFPKIYTCPNEMVAVSMADGWARATGRPQAVIVHVDVGTQAIGQALHNANTGRAPILIFAGLCPYTEDGTIEGSRTEYQHWLQDAPDQKSIVSQYCRYVGDLRTGTTVKQMVFRALQFAKSDPKGPVYLTGAREVLAEKIEPYTVDADKHGPIGPGALPQDAIETIAQALVDAKSPLIITGYTGRNHAAPAELVKLADTIPGLRVLDTGGCDMCFPATHPAYQGFRLSYDLVTTEADTILVLDCDVPWIPARNRPREDAKIFHVDIDPLNARIGVSFFPAHGRWRADSYTALTQINEYFKGASHLQEQLKAPEYVSREEMLVEKYKAKSKSLAKLATPPKDDKLDIHNVGSALSSAVPKDTVFVVEAATNAISLSDQLKVHLPGTWLNSAGAGLGWSGGAALGVKLAYEAEGEPKFVCQVSGDGVFLFSVPSSVYWTASRYEIPVLTIVLNNRGWNAPRKSHELVHPTGLAAATTNRDMFISLEPSADYGGIAKAAAGPTFGSKNQPLWVGKATTASEFATVLEQAVEAVKGGRGALVEVVLSVDEMGDSEVIKE